MGALENPRYEAAARRIAAGEDPDVVWAKLYPKSAPQTAQRRRAKMAKDRAFKARVKELSEEITEQVAERTAAAVAKHTLYTDRYLDDTLKEVIDRCMQGAPVLDTKGNPTGEWKFEPGAVIRALELADRGRVGGQRWVKETRSRKIQEVHPLADLDNAESRSELEKAVNVLAQHGIQVDGPATRH